MTNIRNEKGVITDAMDIKRIIKEYYEHSALKFDNVGDMNRSLERFNYQTHTKKNR